jgi:glucuronoarabinoxylan endo-1,4-beta-xylanase
MASALRIAAMIHEHLTVAEVSAWHYWWLFPNRDTNDNSALTQAGQLTRRAYVLGNWSRFVRPDFVRVTATVSPRRGVLLSAFRDAASQRFVLVAVNENSSDLTQTFALSAVTLNSVIPFTTNAELTLSAGMPIPVSDGHFSAVLTGRSVTSFVGGTADAPPRSGEGGAPATP